MRPRLLITILGAVAALAATGYIVFTGSPDEGSGLGPLGFLGFLGLLGHRRRAPGFRS